jgi:hypothetical protein
MAKVENSAENFKACICAGCPTYGASACPQEKSEKLYCARGLSACELASKGCICGACPVWTKNGLNNFYFCKE